MKFVDKYYIIDFFRGKRVCIVGSAPTVLENEPGYIDSFDIVVRVQNYKIMDERTGKRADVHYSFYGSSSRKTADELKSDGVKLCMCKCPDATVHKTEWHIKNNKLFGCEFNKIYRRRKDWWFCDTYIPVTDTYMHYFNVCGQHVPTTGFAAILEIAECDPKELYVTGFTFMKCEACGKRGWDCKCEKPTVKHDVVAPWHRKNPDDPIRHEPEREYKIFMDMVKKHNFIKLDRSLNG